MYIFEKLCMWAWYNVKKRYQESLSIKDEEELDEDDGQNILSKI